MMSLVVIAGRGEPRDSSLYGGVGGNLKTSLKLRKIKRPHRPL